MKTIIEIYAFEFGFFFFAGEGGGKKKGGKKTIEKP